MATFLDNTIYTNHALRKIGNNLIGNYENFNFIKIKIGSGDNTLDANRQELSTLLYTLRINEVKYADGIMTIICEIPPELAEVPITEIGLFDTVLGVDRLFSYSKVEITKPADLGYELTIVLNLGPRTIDFPGINIFHVPEEEYATQENLSGFKDMFLYVDTNLERVIASNAQKIGYNLAEVAYERQLNINNMLRNNTYANVYYSLFGRYKAGRGTRANVNELADLFFIHQPEFLSYDIVNFATDDSVLVTYDKLFESYHDNITFHNGPVTFAWNTQLDDTTVSSTILNKKNDVNLYFSIDTTQNYEIFKVDPALDGGMPTYHQALYNEMIITLYGMSGTFTLKYIFDLAHKGNYTGQKLPYILTFNGDFNDPEIHFYIDGQEPEEYVEPSLDETEAEREARQESDLYGKIIKDGEGAIADMPDYSFIPLRNYLVDTDGVTKYNYDNALGVDAIITLRKQANKHDVAFLSSIMRSLGEFD